MEKLKTMPPLEHKENDTRQPFVIRGHHLYSYSKLVKGVWDSRVRGYVDVSPGLFSYYQISLYISERNKADKNPKNTTAKKAYFDDLIGTKIDDHLKYESAMTDLYEHFDSLPDDYPVEIVAGRKDEICKECIIGKHCSVTKNTYTELGETRLKRDMECAERFVLGAEILKLGGTIETFENETDFSDAENVTVVNARTTVGTVRQVLGNTFLLDY